MKPLSSQLIKNPRITRYHFIKKNEMIKLLIIESIPIIFTILLSDANIFPIGHPLLSAQFLYEIIIIPVVHSNKKKKCKFVIFSYFKIKKISSSVYVSHLFYFTYMFLCVFNFIIFSLIFCFIFIDSRIAILIFKIYLNLN